MSNESRVGRRESAHEVRGKLAAILVYAEWVAETTQGEAREYASEILSAAVEASRLLETAPLRP
jgi:hypothetical protein